MKKNTLLFFTVFVITLANAQPLRYGIYGGVGFSTEKSDYFNIGTLPVDKGGFNFHYGIHLNYSPGKKIALETGLNKVTKGYSYTSTAGVITTEYTKVTTVTLPITLLVHVINYPESMPVRMSVGAGVYASYALSGKITHEDGTHSNASFGNAKRLEAGPRWMVKFEFLKKFEVYGSADTRSTNIVKNGNGYIRQGSLQMGFGYVFK